MPPASPMARPTSFSGEAVTCNGFLLQCSLYFELQSHQFTTERAKVAFIISLLTGRALQWAEALWSSQSPRINLLEDFVEHFREVFSQPTTEVSVHDELFQLRQTDSSIHEYTLRFRLTQGLCLYCGSAGHQLRTCPIRPPRPAVSTIQITPDISNMPLVDALLRYQDQSYSVRILMDSGAAGNFISSRTLAGFKIPRCKNDTTYQITTVQGKPLGRGLVRSHTPEVSLHIGCFHEERISLLVLEEAVVDVVLGRPWLAKHQPTIDWRSGEILKWDSGCKQRCLRNLPVPVSNNASLSICSTTIESPETCQVSYVPSIMISHLRMCSARKRPHTYLHTDHGTAALTCCTGPSYPEDISTHCRSRREPPWRST